ncbi:MAG TPA: hypothetical protein DDY91_20465 [Planctomycetaceae bacterium]|nr:hypothetical protein [Planctomycetaceae bacterium]
MNLRCEPPPIYFAHLPRTGGTALRDWLRTAYGPRQLLDLRARECPSLDTREAQSRKYYHAWHLGRGPWDRLEQPDLLGLTLLRDPLERAVSEIRNVQRRALSHGLRFTTEFLARLKPVIHGSIEDCLRAGVFDDLISNAQSRVLGSRRDWTIGADSPHVTAVHPLNSVAWSDYPWLATPGNAAVSVSLEDLKRAAKSWLVSLACVGVTERWTDFATLLADHLGIAPPLASQPNHGPTAPNITNRAIGADRVDGELSDWAVGRLRELNDADLELYDQARERFAEQWQRFQGKPRQTPRVAAQIRQGLQPWREVQRRLRNHRRYWPLRTYFLADYPRWFGTRQGWQVILKTLLRQSGEVRIESPQAQVPVSLRLRSSDFFVYGQVLVEREYELPLCREPETIIDAGANIGLASIHFAQRYPRARILAIEPEPSTFDLMRRNVAPFPQVVPIHAALWDHVTTLNLFGSTRGSAAVRTREANPSATGKHDLGSVPTVTIPQLLREHGFAQVDLLKIDIEGAERTVFDRAESWIDRVGAIMIETHDRFEPGCTLAFAAATTDFPVAWREGEHLVAARHDLVRELPASVRNLPTEPGAAFRPEET